MLRGILDLRIGLKSLIPFIHLKKNLEAPKSYALKTRLLKGLAHTLGRTVGIYT